MESPKKSNQEESVNVSPMKPMNLSPMKSNGTAFRKNNQMVEESFGVSEQTSEQIKIVEEHLVNLGYNNLIR